MGMINEKNVKIQQLQRELEKTMEVYKQDINKEEPTHSFDLGKIQFGKCIVADIR